MTSLALPTSSLRPLLFKLPSDRRILALVRDRLGRDALRRACARAVCRGMAAVAAALALAHAIGRGAAIPAIRCSATFFPGSAKFIRGFRSNREFPATHWQGGANQRRSPAKP